jgi:MFS family permease
MGALAPMVVRSARGLGASVGMAGLVVALLGVGPILGDVPAGALTARVGDRTAMLIAAGIAVVTLLGCAIAGTVWELALGVAGTGATNAVFILARQDYSLRSPPRGGEPGSCPRWAACRVSGLSSGRSSVPWWCTAVRCAISTGWLWHARWWPGSWSCSSPTWRIRRRRESAGAALFRCVPW